MNKDKKTRILILVQMIALSMTAVSIPALITTFQREYSLSISQSSIIPVLGTSGGFIINIIITSFSSKVGLKRLNIYFLSTGLSASLILAFSNNFYLFLTGILLVGISTAFGLTNTSTILAHIKLKYQNYGLFHAFFGVGGIISPAIISFLQRNCYSYRNIYYLLISIFTGLIAYVIFSDLVENKKYDRIKFKEAFSILRKRFVLPVLILIAIQAGNEQSIVTWSGNLFNDMFNFSAQSVSLFLSLYWIVFTISRFLIKPIEHKFGKLNTAKLSTVLAIMCLGLLLITDNPLFFILLAATMAPGFPVMQKYSAQKLPVREVGLFNGMIFAFASIGNVIIAGSMGIIGDHSIKLSYIVPIIGAVLILSILIYLTKLKKTGMIKVSPK